MIGRMRVGDWEGDWLGCSQIKNYLAEILQDHGYCSIQEPEEQTS